MAVNALQAVLDRAAQTPEPQVPPVAVKAVKRTKPQPEAKQEVEEPRKFSRPVREGKRFIGGHFSHGVARQLRMIAAEDDTTIQQLLEDALDLLFTKKGRATIAKLGGE
ncbi:ribbon-helix-helix domain-containing protein [Ancylobacter terrae]|uniref:ribbon-helix-helix domain-containing protein n=1 Tax=Ancylobacter sp. sgz301288 TaxID=3342077 RepID=UPI00385D62FE